MSNPSSPGPHPGASRPTAAGLVACQGCRHLYSTWRPERPRGCRAYGFESATWPSAVVEQSSGQGCTLFEARAHGSDQAAGRRRQGTHEGGLYG
jgi:hypothetical protein